MDKLFNLAYKMNLWGSEESVSGPSSTLDYTETMRKVLAGLLRALDCRTLLDAPCGDLNWIKATDLDGITYIGGDIAPSLVADLRARHPGTDVRRIDITAPPLPSADFWLCRDVLFHLSLADILLVLVNFIKSDITYFCTSHFLEVDDNPDVPSSPTTFRPVNLCKPPFGLPGPDYYFRDYPDWHPPRGLAVWRRSRLRAWYAEYAKSGAVAEQATL